MAKEFIVHTKSAYAYPLTIGRILETGVLRAPSQTVVYGDKVRLSYLQLNERVNRLASALASLGVGIGNTVAVMDWDSNRYLEAFFAVPMMGATLHTINIRLSPEQILYTINHAKDDVILVNADFLPTLEQIWDRIERKTALVLIEDHGDTPRTGLPIETEYETLLAASKPNFAFPELNEETRATTFYTTGTTGLPKGVYFSHRQLVLHTITAAAEFRGNGHATFNPNDVYMPITPMFHVHAWGFPYVATMMGAKQVYAGKILPDVLLDLIKKEKVTFSHCVPTILRMLLSHPLSHDVDLKGWKVIIGGAAFPHALAKEALDRGADVFAAYGMSETCPLLTVCRMKPEWEALDLDRQVELRTKAGRPIPMVDLAVVDGDMKPLPHDGQSQGEVVVRAPWLTQGYLYDETGSEKLWDGGWMHTGDIGVIDADGYLKITDRLKDVIKTGGEWVSSLDVEDLLLKSGHLSEAAVIGVPDPKWTERPMAIVVARNGTAASEANLKTHLMAYAEKGIISRYAVPDRIVFVEELPKTSVGKLDKKVLRSRYAQ